MAESLHDPSWHRVASLRPRLRSHARFHRHRYRGQVWYVLQDRSAGRAHRLSPAAHHLAGLMNGERTTQQIWDLASTTFGDDAPTQGEMIRLLGLLHGADLLRCDVPPDTAEMLRRRQRREQQEWWQRFANPMAVQLPLVDPDRFLERWLPLARPLFTPAAALGWGLVVALGCAVAVLHWSELAQPSVAELLEPRNLLVLGIAYPLMKVLHELGHGFATKVWGGEVHEMGILVLVLAPVPYVDASAASAFPDKWQRAAVGAAGIAVELFVAALAVVLWATSEPGLVRSVAYDVAWLGGISTVLFNGNPLIRFDAYYVLADLVEIPNLASRSRQYLAYLVQRHLFGLATARNPVTSRGEAPWFVGYGIASFVYRLFLLFTIALFVAGRFFVVGVLLALVTVALQVVVPLLRHAAFVLTAPWIGEKRLRAVAASAGLGFGLLGLALLLPLPSLTRAEGVVQPSEGSEIRAGSDGFVAQLLAEPGSRVERGDPLVQTAEPSLDAELAVLDGRLRELRAQLHAQRFSDEVQAQITEEALAATRAERERARRRAAESLIRSPGTGTFVLLASGDPVGRFVHQGELVGYVVGPRVDTVRVVLRQPDIARVRDRTERVEARLSRSLDRVVLARVLREVPGASHRIPHPALGTQGGGRIVVDPSDSEGVQTLEPVFQLDVELLEAAPVREIGGRAFVRFDHGAEPLGPRVYRALRRLFLRRLGV